jgi:hypothetical protein
MTATMSSAPTSRSFLQGMWRRQLDHYPNTGPRMVYLAIVVLVTIVLYYQYYVPGAVSPSIIAHFGMTFPYYVYIIVVGNAIGAFGSLAAGLADRWGRANLVAYGLVIVGLLVTFALPNAGSKVSLVLTPPQAETPLTPARSFRDEDVTGPVREYAQAAQGDRVVDTHNVIGRRGKAERRLDRGPYPSRWSWP